MTMPLSPKSSNRPIAREMGHVKASWLCVLVKVARLGSLSVFYVGINKDIGKSLPQLYYIKMKNCCEVCFIYIGVAMAT